ncbi:hypothetical protein GCM10010967_57990 [Dyadobacter beijingensis]|uniref:Terminase large subunit gp17-like C-terminal domain-containing protein n=1 Tax=Dyadobacter beijingensis TaxID=365489 RepID=A0ABQ2IJF5_9BACT|nr:hypothetical protein [Dyadobacter beijingensis]GGN14165.1 hypothetical protein GCM10010967_57990 [Dyadobacter beijingensis]
MDFNVGKMAGIVHTIRNQLPRALDEFIDVFDTPAMIQKIDERYPDHDITVYPDASGDNRKSTNASETDIALLKKAGYKVMVDASNPTVKDRVNGMNAMLCNTYGERRYLINTRKCPKYTQSLERQVWDEKGEPDKKAGFDHPNDGGGYFITKLFPIIKRTMSLAKLSGQ